MKSQRLQNRHSERARITVLIAFSAVLLAAFLAPFTLQAGSVDNLSGRVGQEDNKKAIDKMNPFAEAIYTLGDYYCDQLSSHSYYLNGNQMAFSSRVMGIFVGLVVGMLVAIMFRPKAGGVVLAGVIPMLVDWGMQFTSIYPTTNLFRVSTGLTAGIVISLFISYLLGRFYNDKDQQNP